MTDFDEARYEFYKQLELEGVDFTDTKSILYYANLIHNYAMRRCNGPQMTDYAEELELAAIQNLAKICKGYDIYVDVNGDVRGSVVKLELPSGTWNDSGGPPLYCVPTRRQYAMS